MGSYCLIFLVVLAFLHANANARMITTDQKTFIHPCPPKDTAFANSQQVLVHATAPVSTAESPSSSSSFKDKKNFIYGGVGGFAGMGGYAGVVGGLPMLGGVGGIGKYGGIGGIGGMGGYGGVGGLGGGAAGGGAAGGGAAGGAAGGTGGGIFPCP